MTITLYPAGVLDGFRILPVSLFLTFPKLDTSYRESEGILSHTSISKLDTFESNILDTTRILTSFQGDLLSAYTSKGTSHNCHVDIRDILQDSSVPQ